MFDNLRTHILLSMSYCHVLMLCKCSKNYSLIFQNVTIWTFIMSIMKNWRDESYEGKSHCRKCWEKWKDDSIWFYNEFVQYKMWPMMGTTTILDKRMRLIHWLSILIIIYMENQGRKEKYVYYIVGRIIACTLGSYLKLTPASQNDALMK